MVPTTLREAGERLLIATTKTRSFISLEEELNSFLQGYRRLRVNRSAQQIWYRARKFEGRPFTNLHSMIYRADGSGGFGRANLPYGRVIYGGWNEVVAIHEIGANAKDWVQVIAFRPKNKVQVPCSVVGEYEYFQKTGKSYMGSEIILEQMVRLRAELPEEFEKQVYIDSVLAGLFRQPVANFEPHKYSLTAAYSRYPHEAFNEGLIYPSVKKTQSFNLALSSTLFDLHFEVISTWALQVHEIDAAKGLMSGRKLFHCNDFDSAGYFDPMSRSSDRQMSFTLKDGFRETEYRAGWRKPAYFRRGWTDLASCMGVRNTTGSR